MKNRELLVYAVFLQNRSGSEQATASNDQHGVLLAGS